jgi:predicted dehydrogenase
MQDIGVGLIGYGLGGRAFHAPYVRSTPGMALKAVVSRDPGKVHGDLPGMTVVPSVDALLAQPEIDLVVVSSPDEFHAEHAIAALRAGKHVVVDKPLATTLADARAITAAGEAAGRLVTVFQNRRWDADFLTLKRLIEEGTLGEIVQFESHFDRWRPQVAAVWKEARHGGSWQDLGPHLVDQALQLFGRPEGVSADIAALRDGAPGPDYFHVCLRYPRRRVLLHSSKLMAQHSLRFAVHGTRGSWIKHGLDTQEPAALAGRTPGDDDWGVDPVEGMLTDAGGSTVAVSNARGDYRQLWLQLAAAIRGEAPNPVPAHDGVAVIEIIDAGLQSAAERREVAV